MEGPPIAATFDVKVRDGIVFDFRVTNNAARKLELLFPTGQTHDIVVVDSAEREVWRWSEGRMFTSAMKSETIKGKGETAFEESWDTEGKHGSFTAVAILKSDNFPVETSVQFMLP